MKEFLDIVDEKGEPTGEIIDRETAHAKGIPHRTSHLWLDREEKDFTLQESEVDGVLWMDFEECYEGVKNNAFENCISLEELDILKKML